jgi:hypothetical protein
LVIQTWRPTQVARIGGAVVAAACASLGVFALVASVGDLSGAGLAFGALMIAGAALSLVVPFGAYIRIGHDGVSYRNFISTTTIVWTDLQACKAGYSGIALLRIDGTVSVGFAVQKSNLATWRHWRTRADEVVHSIERAKRDHAS